MLLIWPCRHLGAGECISLVPSVVVKSLTSGVRTTLHFINVSNTIPRQLAILVESVE